MCPRNTARNTRRELEDLRRHGRTGHPLGDETFLGRLEEIVRRAV